MKIIHIKVTGLFGNEKISFYEFNEDINIFTGKNGSGKTTIMKLAWFIMSGNILLALREVDFKICELKTSDYTCTITKTAPLYCKVELKTENETFNFEDDQSDEDGNIFGDSAEEKANEYLKDKGSSIFFPTFRRIEGGFSLETSTPRNRNIFGSQKSDIDDSLSNLSKKLSHNDHLFISAISTKDINSMLLQRYASFSERVNIYQQKVSRSVIEKIKQYQSSESSIVTADSLLSETRKEIEKIEEVRKKIMKPLDAVSGLVERLFQHSGISFGKRLNFGTAANAVNSDVLSAGEKQMLSFICYNAFHKDSVIFIDEPELSLHVDWQRQLYNILKKQNPTNQFIFATHSPFIYGKYPDKEVLINEDRGDKETKSAEDNWA